MATGRGVAKSSVYPCPGRLAIANYATVGIGEAGEREFIAAFCTYCGYSRRSYSRARAARVCNRCGLGMVLRGSERDVPRPHDTFLILDERLRVQATSRRAEVLLSIPEPAGMGHPLDAVLIANSNGGEAEITELVEQAVMGVSSADGLELRTIAHPELRFDAHVASCGPPPAALLMLAPLTDRAASQNGVARRKSQPSGR